MLKKALQQAASLRWLGRTELDERPHDLITFAWDNGLAPTAYIDSTTRLVSKYELLFPDNLPGDAVSELSFPGYREVDGVQVPTGYFQHVGETLATNIEYGSIVVNQPIDDAVFDVPLGYHEIAPPPSGEPKLPRLPTTSTWSRGSRTSATTSSSLPSTTTWSPSTLR
jgi:hypothetical protein